MRSSGLGWPEELVLSSGPSRAPGDDRDSDETVVADEAVRTGLGWPDDNTTGAGPDAGSVVADETGVADESAVADGTGAADEATVVDEAEEPALTDVSRETPVRTLEAHRAGCRAVRR